MKKNHKIRGVVLDVGGVLIQLNWHLTLQHYGLQDWTIQKFVRDLGTWPTYLDFELGRATKEEYFNSCASHYGIKKDSGFFESGWNKIIGSGFDGINELLNRVHPEVSISILSNTNPPHFDKYSVENGFVDIAKRRGKVFASHQIGLRKPDPMAFALVARELGAAPDELLFVDDSVENVEAAKRAGFQAEICENSVARLAGILVGAGVV